MVILLEISKCNVCMNVVRQSVVVLMPLARARESAGGSARLVRAGRGGAERGGEAVVLIVLPRGQHRGTGAGVAVVGRLEAGLGVDVVG